MSESVTEYPLGTFCDTREGKVKCEKSQTEQGHLRGHHVHFHPTRERQLEDEHLLIISHS